MSGFHEVRFPNNIAYGATGGPEFATTVVATGAGHEKRNVNWSEARGRWDVASGLKKQAQIDELIAFFRARKGRAYGFRFKDWTDYRATGQLLGTGDDALTQFQLVKHYPSGSVIEVRTITKPVAGNGDIALIACFASSWTSAMVRRWHADPFGFLRPWNELPALMGSAPPATPPSTATGVVTFLMG
jgi:uncharacterized protein (TIGR02217 family)